MEDSIYSPYIITFIWRHLKNVMNLSKHLQGIDPLCPIYKMELETMDHFFFDCVLPQAAFLGLVLCLHTRDGKQSFRVDS